MNTKQTSKNIFSNIRRFIRRSSGTYQILDGYKMDQTIGPGKRNLVEHDAKHYI